MARFYDTDWIILSRVRLFAVLLYFGESSEDRSAFYLNPFGMLIPG